MKNLSLKTSSKVQNTITFRLPESLMQQLEQEAEKLCTSPSRLARAYLLSLLDQDPKKPLEDIVDQKVEHTIKELDKKFTNMSLYIVNAFEEVINTIEKKDLKENDRS